MARLARSQLPDGIFHAGTTGVDKCTVYADDADRRTFLRLLASVVADYGWDMHSMCLMTTHYHFVVETPREQLSLGMHRLNGRYAQLFNKKFKRTGHLWGDRFWSRVVEDDDYLADVCAYVINNPVRAGLVARPQDWPWSASRYGLE